MCFANFLTDREPAFRRVEHMFFVSDASEHLIILTIVDVMVTTVVKSLIYNIEVSVVRYIVKSKPKGVWLRASIQENNVSGSAEWAHKRLRIRMSLDQVVFYQISQGKEH